MWKLLLFSVYMLMQYHTATATITVPNRREIETFDIYDPIKMDQKFDHITGIIFPIKFETNGRCEIRLRKPQSFARKNTTIPLSNPAFIVMENEAGVNYTGCKSFEDLENAIFRYSNWLVEQKYFPIKAMIVKHWSLNQYFSDLNTGALGYIVGKPAPDHIPIVIAPFESYKRIEYLTRKNWTVGTLTHEPSAWNTILLSTWYKAFLWFFFVLNALFVVHGFGRIVFVWVYGQFRSELRTLAFGIAICSAILNLIAMLLNHPFTFRIVLNISNLLFNISIYLVLIIWCSLKARLQMKWAKLLIISTHATSTIVVLESIVQCIAVFLPVIEESAYFDYMRIGTVNIRMFIGVIFLYFSVIFYKTSRMPMSKSAKRALHQLSLISGVLFLTINIVCIDTFIPYFNENFSEHYYAFVMGNVLKVCAFTGQSASLVYMLGLRMPNENATESVTIWMAFHSLWSKLHKVIFKPHKVGDNTLSIITVTRYISQNTASTSGNMRYVPLSGSHSPSSVLLSVHNSRHQRVDQVLPP